jgi:uncharacterized protein (DUF1800 family)
MDTRPSPAQAQRIAAHRFGFGEPDLSALGADAPGWVLQQLQRPAPMDESGLLGTAEAGALGRKALKAALKPGAKPDAPAALLEPARAELRRATLAAYQRRWQQVVSTPTPVFERWVWFWSNHFCVSGARPVVGGLVLPFEREAIRPHALGRFRDLLGAATTHPAMLIYLDNATSIGPNSRAGQRRERGLNENLGRELLELHTLGVDAGYTQADVTEAARILTGWSLPPARGDDDAEPMATHFNPALHEPGPKQVMGHRYPEGPQGLDGLLDNLARHPATARHLSLQLVRHFVADDPPPALVATLAERWRASDGDLRAVATTLFSHPAAWAVTSTKVKRPDEWLCSAYRCLGAALPAPERSAQALAELGQPIGRPPSPQGWSDVAADWLGPDALLKRVEWAQVLARRDIASVSLPGGPEGMALRSYGAELSATTRRELTQADSPTQALALWLASPDFQRR